MRQEQPLTRTIVLFVKNSNSITFSSTVFWSTRFKPPETKLPSFGGTISEWITFTAANYPVAWRLLETRFGNKKLIFKTYVDALFAIDPMKKECYESLMR